LARAAGFGLNLALGKQGACLRFKLLHSIYTVLHMGLGLGCGPGKVVLSMYLLQEYCMVGQGGACLRFKVVLHLCYLEGVGSLLSVVGLLSAWFTE
jgi:hypothetical protein